MTDGRVRSLRPWVERAWRGEGGAVAFLLKPLALLYAIVAGVARFAAARRRRRVEGMTVVAIGGLSVGGSGKTTLARWGASEAAALGRRPAILLRGHGSAASKGPPRLVPPDAPSDPTAARDFGDEALAHRAALSREVLIVVGRDRRRAAELAKSHGADLAILDDGWEQGTLAWDRLWVLVDASRPFGNGWTLPAGPLRRTPSNLQEANVIVAIAENSLEAGPELPTELTEAGAAAPCVRLRRRVAGWRPISPPGPIAPPTGPSGGDATPPRGPVLLVSSVGSPERLERFLAAEGVPIAEHLAFPDHGAWDRTLVLDRAKSVRDAGGGSLVVTDKDADRARSIGTVALPVWVVSTTAAPEDDPAPLLEAFRSSPGRPVAGAGSIG